jgi:PAS domain S-box-containing protein
MLKIVVLLALSYALVGRLALLLAIPPGYATAIFPPAGIAVAAILLWGWQCVPGVFIGSLAMNLWISLGNAPLSPPVLMLSACVAAGSTLQAGVGAVLVRRLLSPSLTLLEERETLTFMLLAGPVACLVSATFGVSSLVVGGVIPASEFVYSWFTWWVGDTIGVLITAPLVFVFFARPKALWRNRRISVAVPMVAMLSIVLGLFVWVSHWESDRLQYDFRNEANTISERLDARFSEYIDALAAIERFISSSDQVDQADFRHFVDYTLSTKAGINGLSWNPVVTAKDRATFEASALAEGMAEYRIMERDSSGNLIPAGESGYYVAVRYIEPLAYNRWALGFDVASNPTRREALQEARDKGLPIATERLLLVQDRSSETATLVFYPVYHGDPKTLAERQDAIRGYSVGVFRIGDIVESVVSLEVLKTIGMSIIDSSVDAANSLLFESEPGGERQIGPMSWERELNFGGRTWRVHFWPTASYAASHRAWQAWAVMAGGLLFTGLFGVFLLSMTGRAYNVEQLVERRTAELGGILDSALESIIILDESGAIESINPAAESLLGVTQSNCRGRPIADLLPEFVPGPVKTGAQDSIFNLEAGRKDSIALRADHSQVPVEVSVSRVVTESKTLYTVMVHDLTERKKVERMKDEFIAIVSHELRTPLTSIRGALGLLAGQFLHAIPQAAHELILMAQRNSERLTQLINDLLDMQKLTEGRLEIALETVDLVTLVQRASEENHAYAATRHVALKIEKAVASSPVIGNELRLMQVMANLISNAVKYSRPGSVVTLAIRTQGAGWRVEVRDTGEGIPDAFRGQLFSRFAQADSSTSRAKGGTGLGLYITKRIIDLLGGHIGFTSQMGEGTTFYFDLPAPVIQ